MPSGNHLSAMGGGRLPRVICASFLVVYAVPLLLAVYTSFRPNEDVFLWTWSSLWHVTAGGYQAVFTSLLRPLLNSVIIACSGAAIAIVLGAPGAYGLARMESVGFRRLASALLGSMVLLQMVPQASAVIPIYGALVATHLANSLLGVILADAGMLLPFSILLLRPYFAAVPVVLEEASRIDGASSWSTYWRVVLPLTRNGLITVGVITFILLFGEFIYASTLLSSSSLYPLSVVLLLQVGQYETTWNHVLAVACVTALPVLVAFVFAQRHLREGIASGAIV